MTQPLFFEPDPYIPDSDLLGYGDLIFEGGKRQYVNGDPELAASVEPISQVNPVTSAVPMNDPSLDMDAGAPSSDPLTMPEYSPPEMQPIEVPGAPGYMMDPTTGEIRPPGNTTVEHFGGDAGAMAGMDELAGVMPPQGGAPANPTQPVPIPDAPGYHVIPATGEILQPGGQPSSGGGMGAGGMVPVQREGALPADLVAQQAQERAGMNAGMLSATEQARQQEAQIYRQAALQRQGQLDAESAAEQKRVQDEQSKLQRWQSEQQQTSEMAIETDLGSAVGAVGSVFMIAGAAMLGAVGSDAGLRMIDNAINQNVMVQINRRDSKLRMLADRVGSTEQAIAAGKARLYKLAADKVEVTQKITAADAFEAQTPEILQKLRDGQLKWEQQEQKISLGKTLEKVPVPVVPKAADVQKYGKAAADQTQSENNILRAAKALGLEGWDPKTGTFKNRQEVLDGGIAGVGTEDTFARDLGKLPIVGALPQALDNLATSKEGMKVRAALESLVAAEAAAQNPGRAPTDADRDAARLSLGLTTEEGTVAAIERLYAQQEQAKAQNTATYGKSAARAYEQSIDASGTRRPADNGADRGGPLERGSARDAVKQETQRLQGAPGTQSSIDPIRELAGELQVVAGRELPPEGLKILEAQAAHETGDGQHAPNNNMFGHKAGKGQKGAELETTEGEGAGAKRVKQSFAMFNSVGQSALAHVDLLKRLYPDAWHALERGDAPAYVAALKDGGYFTGNETEYLNGIMRRL